MAQDYRVAIGHDVIYTSLSRIMFEPRGGIATPVQRDYGVSGAVHENNFYIPFFWDYIESESDYQSLLSQFGLVPGTDWCPVSLFAMNGRFVWTLYNGIAQYPEYNQDARWNNFFIRDVTLHVVDLQVQV